MKEKIIWFVFLFGLIGCTNYDKDYVNTFSWKYSGGEFEINDFILFGDELVINDNLEIIDKDSGIIGKLVLIKKDEIIIESANNGKVGRYVLFDSASRWK
jgi:hypothetical protein